MSASDSGPSTQGDHGGLESRVASFSAHLTPGRRPALVMVDLVRAYFDPGASLYLGQDDCLHSAARVLEASRNSGILILHTRVSYSEGGIDGGHFFTKVNALKELVGSSLLGDFMPEVTPLSNEPTIVKQYASAFFGTTLASTLSANAIDTLIIAGVSTSGCIRATAVDAIQHGFIPLIPRESVGDRDIGPHESNLFDLQAKYAEVVTEKSILDYLSRLN